MEANNIIELQNTYNVQVEVLKSDLVKKKIETKARYGHNMEFIKKINYHLIDRSGDNNFPAFYNVYDKIFTIEEEKETYEGFEEVLDFNYDRSLQQKFGPFKEVLIYCSTPDDKEVLGGINFQPIILPVSLVKIRFLLNYIIYYMPQDHVKCWSGLS